MAKTFIINGYRLCDTRIKADSWQEALRIYRRADYDYLNRRTVNGAIANDDPSAVIDVETGSEHDLSVFEA